LLVIRSCVQVSLAIELEAAGADIIQTEGGRPLHILN
jgi:hypothetical protein